MKKRISIIDIITTISSTAITGFCGVESIAHVLDYANAKAIMLREQLNPELVNSAYQTLEKMANNSLRNGICYGIAAIFSGLTISLDRRNLNEVSIQKKE